MTDPFNGTTNIEASRRLVDRCIEDLNAAGAKYKILFGGEEYGELAVGNAVAVPPKRKLRNWSKYTECVKEMAPGDSLDFKPGDEESLVGLAKALSGVGRHHFGSRNFKILSNNINNTISVKRLK